MSDPFTKRWVGDQLHSILGFAEPTLADYMISLGVFVFVVHQREVDISSLGS